MSFKPIPEQQQIPKRKILPFVNLNNEIYCYFLLFLQYGNFYFQISTNNNIAIHVLNTGDHFFQYSSFLGIFIYFIMLYFLHSLPLKCDYAVLNKACKAICLSH